MRDHRFGDPANGDDSPKGATSTPAALTKHSGYKSRLMKLNSPANSEEVEVIAPGPTSGALWVSERGAGALLGGRRPHLGMRT